nr:retrovirus-related Pol polyprotein from transposon TNT 1-94 [Tanacetum cinerariifolium]
MRPFGCLVAILTTKDHLSKFDGKADDEFFIGYYLNSKAFRVFNNRTRIIKENLHIRFSENTPNIAGSGPIRLSDFDALIKSMNYKPVVTRKQSDGNAGTKACDDAEKELRELLQALVDGKKAIITESTIRRDLQLEDAEGVDCLPNAAIFEQLTLMGYEKILEKLTFHVADEAVNEEMDDSLERAATTATSLMQPSSQGTSLSGGLRCQEAIGDTVTQTRCGLGEEDASKKGRIANIDANEDIYLVNVHNDEEMFDADKDLHGTTAATNPTILIDEVTLAQALSKLKHTKPKAKAKGIVFYEPEEFTTTTTAAIPKLKSQDKALQEEDANIALIESWDDVQAKIDADYLLAERLEDVETLWKLVKAKDGSTRPEVDYERVLQGDLKVMFDPHVEDKV